MRCEIDETPQAIETLLTRGLPSILEAVDQMRETNPQLIALNGRGSSDHAGVVARYHIMRRLGLPTTSASPSIASIYRASLKLPRSVCISVSQSGASPDLIETATQMKSNGAHTIAVTNNAGSALAATSEQTIDIHAGPEHSVAATKSFICSVVALLKLVDLCDGSKQSSAISALPELLACSDSSDWTELFSRFSSSQGLYVVGRGPCYGIAREMALKFKETCQIHAEAYSTAECSHGPLALVDGEFPVIVLAQQDESYSESLEFATRLIEMKAPVILVGASLPGATQLSLPKVHHSISPVLMIHRFYEAVADLAISLGKNPDRPRALQKVTLTQ